MAQNEFIIWKDYSMSSYRRSYAIGLIVIGVLLTLTVFLAVLGIIAIVINLVTFFVLKKANEYVVTNARAMHLRFGKVHKEVPLNTQGLVVSLVNSQFVSTRYFGSHTFVDVVFLANGVELMRFRKTSKGDELMAKLSSMGFNLT
jgi:ABC-type microcin C transport system permease subunit YejB